MTDFAGGHFLFIYSDTFAARIIVYSHNPQVTDRQTDRQTENSIN